MKIRLSTRVPRMLSPLLISLLFSLFHPLPLFAGQQDKDDHQPDHAKVVGGYFEEWSIYFAGFNIANLQANGVADKLTHLSYAFGNATPSGCAIADSWADYQNPFLPSVSGAPYTGPLFGNFAGPPATEAIASQSESTDLACRR